MSTLIDPRLYQLMAERVQDYAIFLLDTDGRIMSWNSGAEAIKQYSAKEIIGRHFSTFYTPSDITRGWPEYELSRAKVQGRFEDEGWRIRKDGSRFWANVVITALRDDDGKLLAFSKITRDITARKQQEQDLRESEERFRLLVDGVEDYAIYLLNPEGVVVSWNSGARRIKGYESDEVIGSHFSKFYPPEDIEKGQPWIELAIARHTGRAEDEGWRVRKDGSRFWARVVVTALYDTDGAVRAFAKVTQDLTERRHSEALETSSKALSDFVAVLAHELRNPLAPIRQAAQLAGLAEADKATQQKALSVIDRQSAQLGRIVDDLLDVSRITRGTLTTKPELTSIAKVIERAIETVRPALDTAGHNLTVELPADTLFVNADELRLAQALVNVLGNAIRYTDAGGNIWIRVFSSTGKTGASVCVSIKDDGRGIDPQLLDSVFGMFVQGRDASSHSSGGMGVGLALARAIIDMHHGTIVGRSDGVGEGSEFAICLPLVRESPMATKPDRPSTRFNVKRKRLLVVDDNVDAASILTLLLRTRGHDVVTAHSGADALKTFDSFKPEAVLLDIGMPGMSGLDVARRMRERNLRPSPLIVAVTGWGNPDDVIRSREAGFDAHLVKPVAEAALLDLLETA